MSKELAEAAEKLAIARWDREYQGEIPWDTAIKAGLAAKRLMDAARDLGFDPDRGTWTGTALVSPPQDSQP